VIDSGFSRQPRFSPRTGMTRLETTRVSRASADQRRGRAGRLGPGVCLRLWPEHENSHLLANTPPEGRDAGIVANVIAPYAKTRPETGFGPFPASAELNEWLHPRLVAPLVGWLAHEACPVTGECFSVGGGHYARVTLEITHGLVDRDATIERIAAGASEILDSARAPVAGAQGSSAMRRMFEGFRPAGAG